MPSSSAMASAPHNRSLDSFAAGRFEDSVNDIAQPHKVVRMLLRAVSRPSPQGPDRLLHWLWKPLNQSGIGDVDSFADGCKSSESAVPMTRRVQQADQPSPMRRHATPQARARISAASGTPCKPAPSSPSVATLCRKRDDRARRKPSGGEQTMLHAGKGEPLRLSLTWGLRTGKGYYPARQRGSVSRIAWVCDRCACARLFPQASRCRTQRAWRYLPELPPPCCRPGFCSQVLVSIEYPPPPGVGGLALV